MPKIDFIRTGVPGFDSVLGGGIPAGSFNVIGGDPGAGKTTLAHQILFANATPDRPALFCTVVGEPPIKMLRYQQQYEFFDIDKIGSSIHYMNLTDEVLDGDLNSVLDSIAKEVERLEPALIVVDSFRSVTHRVPDADATRGDQLRRFVQRLSNFMTRWEATSFLLGEFHERDTSANPIFTVADGVVWMNGVPQLDTRVRKLSVSKVRGSSELPGRHVYRISKAGIRVFPRAIEELDTRTGPKRSERVEWGIPELDRMMHGGLVRGDAVIVAGPTGAGKSVLGMHFVHAGLLEGESAVVATFEESRKKYLQRATQMGMLIPDAVEDGRVSLLHRRPLDLSIDETFSDIRVEVERTGASRVVVDSLSGLLVATSGVQTERLRESMGRLVHALTEAGITVLLTAELNQQSDQLRFTPHESSFLADDVILMRYVEVRGELQTVISVIKMRRSGHSRLFHRYAISAEGFSIGAALTGFHGILTGVPRVEGPANVQMGGGAVKDSIPEPE